MHRTSGMVIHDIPNPLLVTLHKLVHGNAIEYTSLLWLWSLFSTPHSLVFYESLIKLGKKTWSMLPPSTIMCIYFIVYTHEIFTLYIGVIMVPHSSPYIYSCYILIKLYRFRVLAPALGWQLAGFWVVILTGLYLHQKKIWKKEKNIISKIWSLTCVIIYMIFLKKEIKEQN